MRFCSKDTRLFLELRVLVSAMNLVNFHFEQFFCYHWDWDLVFVVVVVVVVVVFLMASW